VGSWTAANRDLATPASRGDSLTSIIAVLVLLLVAAVQARANLRSGRADRRGAFRLGTFFFVLVMISWVFGDHVREIGTERTRLFLNVGLSLFIGGAMYVIYLALEPHVRRSWPTLLVGWTRVLQGRVRDATIGRDLLVATALGVVYAGVTIGLHHLSFLNGGVAPRPYQPDIAALAGLRHWVLSTTTALNSGVQNGLLNMLALILIRELVRRIARAFGQKGPRIDMVATIVAVVVAMTVSSVGNIKDRADVVEVVLTSAIDFAVLFRLGIFAACAMSVVRYFVERIPLTLDGGRFYSDTAWISMALVVVLAGVSFWLARADEPLFGTPAEGN
jgi:hypothetical protein